MRSARDILQLAVLLLAVGAAVGAGCIGGDEPPAGPGTTGGADESGAEDIEVVASALRNGQSCTRSRQCDSGHCVDGHCCNTACAGTCRTCATGTCSPVLNADDPNSCAGTLTCNAAGICVGKSGQVCSASSQCASGFCVDGRCCSSACNGVCQTCATPTGTCTIVTSADDNTCTGTLTCNAAGICVSK